MRRVVERISVELIVTSLQHLQPLQSAPSNVTNKMFAERNIDKFLWSHTWIVRQRKPLDRADSGVAFINILYLCYQGY